MIHAYDQIYLEKAKTALGRMFDFTVHDLHFDLTDFFNLFLSSGIASDFEKGDFSYTVGKSGVELAYEVLWRCRKEVSPVKPVYTANRGREYWAGWALAHYQWETALTFSEIIRCVPITQILELYTPYHEMDIRQFTDQMNELILYSRPETKLAYYRKLANLSQRELSVSSGVPLRTIQQYEQRQKNINKAQVGYLVMLSRALFCTVEDLIEKTDVSHMPC